MGKRRRVPKDVEDDIIINCRRRCCICYGLYHDIGVKEGQIAHLDRDSTNSDKDNLAFLCFEHHNQFDSKTSQGKGYSKGEVACYRDELCRDVKEKDFWV